MTIAVFCKESSQRANFDAGEAGCDCEQICTLSEKRFAHLSDEDCVAYILELLHEQGGNWCDDPEEVAKVEDCERWVLAAKYFAEIGAVAKREHDIGYQDHGDNAEQGAAS